MVKKNVANEEGGVLTVTAQQSRFHADAVDDPSLKELVVKDLCVSVGQREILSHADLNLQPGHHYVLTGRNGVGKSTLFTALASGLIPSIPRNVRILLLTQLTPEGFSFSGDESVLEHVIRSDKNRERLLSEVSRLSAAIDSNDPSTISLILRQLNHEQLERELDEARRIAARRSGARGAKSRKQLIKAEEELAKSLEQLNLSTPNDIETAHERLTTAQLSLEGIKSSSAESRAKKILLGLGFSTESLNKPISHLSGGWKTRCNLACALYQPCDLLLLDEPTNFLDLPSIIWLEKYIQELDGKTTVVVTTHDRLFADSVCDSLLVQRDLQLEGFTGNLSAYELQRAKTAKYMTRMKEAQEKQKKHMQGSVEKNLKAARRTGDDKKLKQAASRKKKLDERMGLEVSAKGGKFKLNRDLAGYHTTMRAEIEVPTFEPLPRVAFPTEPGGLRFPGAVVSLEGVGFCYPGRQKGKGVEILRDVTLTVQQGERVGIVGLNGAGKSTLVGLVTGGLSPTKGEVKRHSRAKVGVYSQEARGRFESEGSALNHLMDLAKGALSEQEARGVLSGLGLVGQTASDVPVRLLSGGQKARLALAEVLWDPPHLLILDEVTTHLDADTILGLAGALRGYQGAILVVSHDRWFMRCVVEGESTKNLARRELDEEDEESSDDEEEEEGKRGTVYHLTKGLLKVLPGGVKQYEERAEKASMKLGKT
ncbi:ABC transporter ATP-binding protein uup-1 [Piedraia hortae CBS 480.64]|uniref:ABC transporter ATP-binding protein uup-1 n=1 Tax=Piedraia hortae CBS 480.64 TaxID=1314780 RepID=A0A6A7BWZ0_9PEZI|nr:ABC transporter ATP-binding protein uup-1 [Piedraia hortae CBS 480.64]